MTAQSGGNTRNKVGAFSEILVVVVMSFSLSTLALDPDRPISQHTARTWSLDDGLPHDTVRAIVEDDEGWIWLATYDGIARFDGQRFVVFDSSTVPGLPSPTVRSILVEPDGSMWVGTNGGLTQWSGGTGTPTVLRDPLASSILDLIRDPGGALWVATGDAGLVRLEQDAVSSWTRDEGLPSDSIWTLDFDDEGSLWIGTHDGLGRWRNGQMEEIPGFGGESIRAILCEASVVWVGTDRGLLRWQEGRIDQVPHLLDDQVTSLLRDRRGSLWVGTYNRGLLRLTGPEGELSVDSGLRDSSVRSLMEDSAGALWIGTNGGVVRLKAGPFLSWGNEEGLPDDYVRAVLPDGDRLWVATAGGLARLDPETGVDLVIGKNDGLPDDYAMSLGPARDGGLWIGTIAGVVHRDREGRLDVWDSARGLPHDVVRAVIETDDGDFWVGTDGGLAVGRQGAIELRRSAASLGSEFVVGLARDLAGTIWIATDGGGLVSVAGGTTKSIEGLPTNHLLCLFVEPSGRVWVGTDGGGLAILEAGADRPRVLTSEDGLGSDKITQILDDGNGGIWLGSNRGLTLLNRDEILESLDTGETLNSVRYFGRGDGLRTAQMNGISQSTAARDGEGRLWFATARGVVSTSPALLESYASEDPPKVIIEAVAIDGVPQAFSKTIVVPAGTRRIEAQWVAFEFGVPELVRFRYRLDPSDSEWIDIGASRSVRMSSPEPGRVRLRVAVSIDGRKWRESKPVDFLIQAPWTERREVRALFALVVLGVFFGTHRFRLRALRRRSVDLERRVDERTKEILAEKNRTEKALRESERHKAEAIRARALAEEANEAKSAFLAMASHDVRTPLTAIVGFSSLLQLECGDDAFNYAQEIDRSATNLLNLIDDLLDLGKVEAGEMILRLESVDPEALAGKVKEQLVGILVPAGVCLEVDAEPHEVIVADPLMIRRVLVNLIANAVKFSPEGSVVRLRIRMDGSQKGKSDELRIDVVDRGPGISLEEQGRVFEAYRQASQGPRPKGTGLGLAIVLQLVELHGGRVELESTLGEGSVFSVFLPVAGPSD